VDNKAGRVGRCHQTNRADQARARSNDAPHWR
jgi:hypothetical protein